MKLREFFKPNAVKLVITIILIILIPFVYYYPCLDNSLINNPYRGITLQENLGIGCGISFMNINKFLLISKYGIFYNLLPFFIINILGFYLLSCIIFALINKIKKE